MRRRAFIAGLAGSAATWPLTGHGQQRERMRRIGVLFAIAANDAETQARYAAFLQGMQEKGWAVGRNIQIDTRFSGVGEDTRKHATELVALRPDVIVAAGSAAVTPLQQTDRTVPIVFAIVPDPVGAGFVDSLARPGGSSTGLMSFEYGIAAKWLELLKEVAPGVTRAAVIRDAKITAGIGQWGSIQTAAPSFGVEVSPVNVGSASEIEGAVATFAQSTRTGGLIVTAGPAQTFHRDLLVGLAARHKLPAVFFGSYFTARAG